MNFFYKFIQASGIDKLKDINNALDFGCGPEPVLKVLLNRLGLEVDIFDLYFFPQEVFINKKYDLITCTEVFEHLKNPLDTLVLLESLLNENGILAVKTLFHTTCNDFRNWWYRRDSTHICFYSQHTFKWIEDHFNFIIELIDNNSICVFRKKIVTIKPNI